MRTRLALCCCVLVGLATSLLAGGAEGIPGVNSLLDRIEKAHTSRDAKLLLDECTDDGLVAIVYGGPPDKRAARVMTKKQMTAELFNRMWMMRQLKSRRKTDRDILLAHPDIALLTATTVDTVADGRTTSHREFYVVRRSGGTWRVCFTMPLLFRSTLVAAYVQPGSHAERAGLKVGDEVTSCAGVKTDRVVSDQKINALLKAEPKEVPLVVRRGAEELRVTIPGAHGLGGAGFERVLFPLAPAVLLGPGQSHPTKEDLKRDVEMIRTGDFDGFDNSFHPDGFFTYLPQLGKPTRLMGCDEFGGLLRKASETHRKVMDPSKTRVDRISVITDGNVAIVAGDWTYKMRERDKQRTVPTQAQVYVRRGEQWLKVALLAQRARIGSPHAVGPKTSDAAAVRRVAVEFVSLFASTRPGAGERLVQLFADDCILVASNGKSYKGRKTIAETYTKGRREIFEAFETFIARYDIESVRVTGDQAVVFGPIEMSGRTTGGQDFRKRIWETLVLRRTASSWKIIHEHSSTVPEDQQ